MSTRRPAADAWSSGGDGMHSVHSINIQIGVCFGAGPFLGQRRLPAAVPRQHRCAAHVADLRRMKSPRESVSFIAPLSVRVAQASSPASGRWERPRLLGKGAPLVPLRRRPQARVHAALRLRCVEGTDSLKGIQVDCEQKMEKTIVSLRNNLAAIRTSRASPALLNRIQVKYYGVDTPLLQLASISTPSSTALQIEPYDKSCLGDIERAIAESDLGLTPSNDGNVIRLNVPPLTEERRKQLVKAAKEMAEESRVALRNIRRTGVDAVKKLEKGSEISKDLSADAQDELTKMIKRFEAKVDEIMRAKEKDIMTV